MKTRDQPYERKIMSPDERRKLAEEEAKRNKPVNDMLRGIRGEHVEHASMNQFIREGAQRGESSDPQLAAALASETTDSLHEILGRLDRAKQKNTDDIPSQRKVSAIIRAVLKELRNRKAL